MKKLILITLFVLIPSLSHQEELSEVQNIALDLGQQIECMAKNIYYEAGSEPYEGKLAVAQVTMNRTRSPQFPHNVCEVVYQKDQFSWVNEKHKSTTDKYSWEECILIARRALTEYKLHDKIYNTGAMYFHNTSVHPEWKFRYVAKIGNHLFYTK
jgi:spore germination cell wall hydrolase CwlJ-like protein